MARLLSVNVGLPRDIAWQGKTVQSVRSRPAEWCAGSTSTAMVKATWRGMAANSARSSCIRSNPITFGKPFGRKDFTMGQFGENFTVDGLPDNEVRIGDRFRIGGAVFEVTQPRVTCYRVGIRMNDPQMPALLVAEGRPGFYLRVLEEGEVEAGDEIVKIAAGPQATRTLSSRPLRSNSQVYIPRLAGRRR